METLRPDIRLEVEGALVPGEEQVDRLLDLHAHMVVQPLAGDEPEVHEQVADALVAVFALCVDGALQLLLRDGARLHEHVADAIAPVDNRRVRDLARLEVDVPEVVAMRDAEAAGLAPHGEELQDIGEGRLAQ
jgi:hypothetical protein